MQRNTTRDLVFSAAILAACIVMGFLDLSPASSPVIGQHCRALVRAADNSRVQTNLIIKTQHQVLDVVLLNGPHKDYEMSVVNQLTGKLEFDEFYEEGDIVLLEYDIKDDKPAYGTVRGHDRLKLQAALIVAFAVLLLAVAGITGIKALLSFVFAAMVLWTLYFPLLLRSYPPIATGIALVALLTAVITLSVGGISRLGISAFSGSMLGILLTCVLALWFANAFKLHGAVRPFAEMLLYSGYIELNISHIFIASIFIASSGAVMDIAMDIAATMDEIYRANPYISFAEHIKSGMRVGRVVVGTMTTTLLLAYSSSHIMMFMVFQAKGLPMINLVNAPFVAAEILNILVGSFGLVTVVPFTALSAGLLYHNKR